MIWKMQEVGEGIKKRIAIEIEGIDRKNKEKI